MVRFFVLLAVAGALAFVGVSAAHHGAQSMRAAQAARMAAIDCATEGRDCAAK